MGDELWKEIIEKYYTTGEFAKKAGGVTIRTIRYYDKKGLLNPTSRGENGYRLYSGKDFAMLQRILTLKYLGFPLESIGHAMNYKVGKEELKQSLEEQKNILEDKLIHMKLVIKAIEKTQAIMDDQEELVWDNCINIINVINAEAEVMHQYKNSSNLRARINIHDRYSTNKYGWHKWLFDNIVIPPKAKILEIGCGDGSLWLKNINRIPNDCEITLSDTYDGMLEDAKRNLGKHADKLEFRKMDGDNINFKNETFDIIIANHMLYYINDRRKFFEEVQRVLKNDGCFYASTIGDHHMKELKDLVKKYDSRIELEKTKFSSRFGLETGKSQLEKCFQNVELYNYEDSLIVDDAKPIIAYLYSTHGNLQEIIKDKEADFERFIENEIINNKTIFISKYSGLFICKDE